MKGLTLPVATVNVLLAALITCGAWMVKSNYELANEISRLTGRVDALERLLTPRAADSQPGLLGVRGR